MHAGVSNRIEKQGLYQCSQCQRRYHRTEHLARHVRSIHTKQRPYPCRSCGKAFGRLDILKRHEGTHDDAHQVERVCLRENGGAEKDDDRVGERVSRACGSCKAAKVKCSERKPCSRCVGKGLRCDYERVEEDGGVSEKAEEQGSIGVEVAGPFEGDIAGQMPPDLNHAVDEAALLDSLYPSYLRLRASQDIAAYDQDAQMLENLSFGADWDLAMTDFSCLQTRFDAIGADTLVLTPDMKGHPSSTIPLSCETPSATGSWEPQSRENSEMEISNLAADEKDIKPPSMDSTPDTPVALPLSAADRNGIVGMILNNTSRANAGPVLAAFPSTGALGTLVGVYARDWEAAKINDVVHLPTLRFDCQRSELLGVVVAIGAISAGSTVTTKFGFAMQEVVRIASFRNWEENNADLCDVGLAQAFFLQQRIAFFSGVRRKVAFAEGCSKCMQFIMKNGGHSMGAAEADDPELGDVADLGGQALEEAWRRWTVRESQRRLVYAAYIMDANVSMTHGTQVQSSYSSMKTPFPAPRRLWKAQTAVRWKEEMVLLRSIPESTQSLCLRDLMGDPTQVVAHRSKIDADFVVLGYLAGFWALVNECQQLRAISEGMRGPWSSMILSSRRVELSSTLKHFASQVETAGLGISPEAELLIEVLHMHVLAPPDDSQSRTVPSSFSTPTTAYDFALVRTAEHREALWRAGRAVRVAARCPARMLCDIYASALSQAAMFLWWHGVVSSQASELEAVSGRDATIFAVDGDEAHEYQMLGEDIRLALLGTASEPVLLADPAGVARRVRGVIEHNWEHVRMPSGVEEVCRVLENLERTAQRCEGGLVHDQSACKPQLTTTADSSAGTMGLIG